MSGGLRLMMAQVDDVPGELMGEFICRAEALGARNVQVVSSITKKNRPAYLVYLDVPAALEAAAARLLGAELGCWGYRVLQAEHHHFDIARTTVALTVRRGGVSRQSSMRIKTISNGDERLRVKAEHDDLVSLCAALRDARADRLADAHADVPLAVLKAAVESQLAVMSPLPDSLTLIL